MIEFSSKLILILLIGTFITACDYSPPTYWPVNNTEVKRIKWYLPLQDSLNILQKSNNRWLLPEPSDTLQTQIHTSYFRTPELNQYSEYLGRIDQEVFHSTQQGITEFYRFENKNVFFLGFTSPDTSKPLIMFDPPLMVLPNNILNLEKIFESTTVMKTLNSISGEFIIGDTTRLTLKKLESGFIEKGKFNTSLFEMKITSDKTIQFGGSGLLVPEAVLLKSKFLIGQTGTVLEWEVRSKVKRQNENGENTMPGSEDRMEEREYYIEITKYTK